MDARLTKPALGAGALGAAALLVLVSLGTPAQAASTPWSPETDCTVCHESQAATVAAPAHEALGCTICHGDANALADVHADVDESSRSPRRLKATDVADATCLGCHGDGMAAVPKTGQGAPDQKTSDTAGAAGNAGAQAIPDTASRPASDAEQKSTATAAEATPAGADKAATDKAATDKAADSTAAEPGRSALVAATAHSTVLTDENGTTVNPHDLPAVEDHASVGCIDCHKGHTDDTLEASAMKACALCHHENVFECYTCHE